MSKVSLSDADLVALIGRYRAAEAAAHEEARRFTASGGVERSKTAHLAWEQAYDAIPPQVYKRAVTLGLLQLGEIGPNTVTRERQRLAKKRRSLKEREEKMRAPHRSRGRRSPQQQDEAVGLRRRSPSGRSRGFAEINIVASLAGAGLGYSGKLDTLTTARPMGVAPTGFAIVGLLGAAAVAHFYRKKRHAPDIRDGALASAGGLVLGALVRANRKAAGA